METSDTQLEPELAGGYDATFSVPAAGVVAGHEDAESSETAAPRSTGDRQHWGSETDSHQRRHVTSASMTSYDDVRSQCSMPAQSSEVPRGVKTEAACSTGEKDLERNEELLVSSASSAGAVAGHEVAARMPRSDRPKPLRGGSAAKMSVVESSEKLLKEFEAIKKLKLFTRGSRKPPSSGSQMTDRLAGKSSQATDTRAASSKTPSQAADRHAGSGQRRNSSSVSSEPRLTARRQSATGSSATQSSPAARPRNGNQTSSTTKHKTGGTCTAVGGAKSRKPANDKQGRL